MGRWLVDLILSVSLHVDYKISIQFCCEMPYYQIIDNRIFVCPGIIFQRTGQLRKQGLTESHMRIRPVQFKQSFNCHSGEEGQ